MRISWNNTSVSALDYQPSQQTGEWVMPLLLCTLLSREEWPIRPLAMCAMQIVRLLIGVCVCVAGPWAVDLVCDATSYSVANQGILIHGLSCKKCVVKCCCIHPPCDATSSPDYLYYLFSAAWKHFQCAAYRALLRKVPSVIHNRWKHTSWRVNVREIRSLSYITLIYVPTNTKKDKGLLASRSAQKSLLSTSPTKTKPHFLLLSPEKIPF